MSAKKGVSELVQRIEGYNEGFEIIDIHQDEDDPTEYRIVVKVVPVEEDK